MADLCPLHHLPYRHRLERLLGCPPEVEIVEYGEAYGAHNLGKRRNTCIIQPFGQECCVHRYFMDAYTWCDQAKDYGLHLYNG